MYWIYVFFLMHQFLTQNSRYKFLSFPQVQITKGGGNYDLLYQNSTRKYEDDLEHWFIYILYDL